MIRSTLSQRTEQPLVESSMGGHHPHSMRTGRTPTRGPARLATLAQALDSLLDEHVGVIETVTEMPMPAGAPRYFHYWAYGANTSAFSYQGNSRDGGGAAATREGAVAKAVGEVVERYCSAIFDQDELAFETAGQASFPCVAPEEFALYTDVQYAD